MQKRLCGREQEFGMKVLPDQGLSPFFMSMASRIFEAGNIDKFSHERDIISQIIIKSVHKEFLGYLDGNPRLWMRNGGLIYIDLNGILELAGAETLAGSYEGILQEKANELILNSILANAAEQLGKKNIILYKNNVGPVGPDEKGIDLYKEATYGAHQNYSYQFDCQDKIYKLMESFIPATLPISGSGHIIREGNEFLFVLSQRAKHIQSSKSDPTTMNRGIVNLRKERLMDEISKMGRLHIISRDATRCEFQTWLVDSITHLVLRLAEEGWELPQIITQPVAALQNINKAYPDLSDCALFVQSKSEPNIKINWINYNLIFLKSAKQLNPLSEKEKLALDGWEWVLDVLKSGDHSKLIGYLDWPTKKFLIDKMGSDPEHLFDLSDNRAWRISQGYHALNPEFSWFNRLDEAGYIHHLVSKEEIENAVFSPPNTRAKSRGEFIGLCHKNHWITKLLHHMDWDKVYFPKANSDAQEKYICFGEPNDPFSPTSTSLEDFKKAYKDKLVL